MTTAQLVANHCAADTPDRGSGQGNDRQSLALDSCQLRQFLCGDGSAEVACSTDPSVKIPKGTLASPQLTVPRYQLALEVGRGGNPHAWRFVLRPSDGHRVLAIEDHEPHVSGEQLELLTLIRGLEALDQPSAVTVYGCSRYLRQGMTYGLPEWRENGWQWERFGQLVAIKHVELWQRLNRAMQIHQIACGVRRIDISHGGPGAWHRFNGKKRTAGLREGFVDWVKYRGQSLLLAIASRVVPQPG